MQRRRLLGLDLGWICGTYEEDKRISLPLSSWNARNVALTPEAAPQLLYLQVWRWSGGVRLRGPKRRSSLHREMCRGGGSLLRPRGEKRFNIHVPAKTFPPLFC